MKMGCALGLVFCLNLGGFGNFRVPAASNINGSPTLPKETFEGVKNVHGVNPYHVDMTIRSAVLVKLKPNQEYSIQVKPPQNESSSLYVTVNKFQPATSSAPESWEEFTNWRYDPQQKLTMKSSDLGQAEKCLISLWVPEIELNKKGGTQPIDIPFVNLVESTTREAGRTIKHFTLRFQADGGSHLVFAVTLSRPEP